MYKLIISDKNYSSWSCRAWLLLKHFEVDFIEETIRFQDPNFSSKLQAYSPIKKVPILIDNDLIIADSLAIAEYLAEQHPEKQMWPEDPHTRACARVLSATIHSGFPILRRLLPMNINSIGELQTPQHAELDVEIPLIFELLKAAKEKFNAGGRFLSDEFLFGQYSIADAFFTPIACRFKTYNQSVPDEFKLYFEALLETPAMKTWLQGAKNENIV